MRKILFPVFGFFMSVSLAFGVSTSKVFTDSADIPAWSDAAIKILVSKNIISGNDDGSFAPERLMNRAEFSKLIVNATETELFLPENESFPDVKRGDWFFSFVETARYERWVSGYPDGTFIPAGTINRAEVAKILVRAFDLEIPEISAPKDWSEPYFRALSDAGLLAYGSNFSTLDAATNPTRAEIVEQVFRVMKHQGLISAFDLSQAGIDTQEHQMPIDDYQEVSMPQTMTLNPLAGQLYIEKYPGLPQDQKVYKGEKEVLLHRFAVKSQAGIVHMDGITLKHIGTGSISFFEDLWIEWGNREVSKRITPSGDMVTFEFSSPITISKTEELLTLRGNMRLVPATDKQSRFVLYRPDWISADTTDRIGFFPMGGIDISFR